MSPIDTTRVMISCGVSVNITRQDGLMLTHVVNHECSSTVYVSCHRTTVSNHRTRLPLLFDTWLTKVNTSQVFLVTDGEDPVLRLLTRIKGN